MDKITQNGIDIISPIALGGAFENVSTVVDSTKITVSTNLWSQLLPRVGEASDTLTLSISRSAPEQYVKSGSPPKNTA